MKDKSENDKQSNSENTTQDNSILFKKLGILNLTQALVILILIATILSLEFVQWNILNVLDDINNTSFADQAADLTEYPKISNRIFIITTIVFIFINKDAYMTEVSLTGEERDENAIIDAWRNLLAVILVLFATYLNYTVLNRPKE